MDREGQQQPAGVQIRSRGGSLAIRITPLKVFRSVGARQQFRVFTVQKAARTTSPRWTTVQRAKLEDHISVTSSYHPANLSPEHSRIEKL
jgi:uracil-DNA glycosylase